MSRNCANCDRTIAAKRLAAIPDAMYCILCQPLFDQRVKPRDTVMAVEADLDGDMVSAVAREYSRGAA